MEEMEFEDAEGNMRDLVTEYQQYQEAKVYDDKSDYDLEEDITG